MGMILSLEDIKKSYNGKQVLKGCSYIFGESGTVALMGPNGSGKSTLLRICALLEETDSGTVRFTSDRSALVQDIHLRRKITLVLPGIGVFNSSVFRNISYGLRIRNTGKEEMMERCNEVLVLTGLKGKEHENALTLSSGQKQRLGIARALVLRPDVLFLDEPTASVDRENREIIEDVLKKLAEEKKCLTIIATHEHAQAERLTDTVLFMENGTIVEG